MKEGIKKIDPSTEEKIKNAARIVFYKKGFAATRTRDIAEEAGINLALLNYYFRSKAKLFEIIMIETMSGFFQNLLIVLNNKKTTLDEKVEEVVGRYIDLIIKEPEIPTFIISELRNNPNLLLQRIPLKEVIKTSVFLKQHQEAVEKGIIKASNPLHFLINMLGLTVFPFIAKPMLLGSNELNDKEFENLMLERKKLIPMWIKATMSAG
ncbi:TetR family transcriptional regulator [Chryseobacterium lactis]|uniref:TetR family transcriptional regulator n=1 Tax=Chryseobacterium lactis TaxID=1241981 RepID=A0A3G6RQD7_CHRLC|nr:TetR/AcrR family transcriptional regulator [Chryseobacterium lactis]AZA83701.1 TetR/AcrR family transcriptional regulator [Chryseobacterium lactis]AZB04086.1 TetR/AcrR family transcriptional regulator [Chryseobacterium lactis]PNW13006.1 TetR family transcriptional regulator [Chryseobacterium lactis]